MPRASCCGSGRGPSSDASGTSSGGCAVCASAAGSTPRTSSDSMGRCAVSKRVSPGERGTVRGWPKPCSGRWGCGATCTTGRAPRFARWTHARNSARTGRCDMDGASLCSVRVACQRPAPHDWCGGTPEPVYLRPGCPKTEEALINMRDCFVFGARGVGSKSRPGDGPVFAFTWDTNGIREPC